MNPSTREVQEEVRTLGEIPSLNLHEVLAESARVAYSLPACDEADMTAPSGYSPEANQELHLVASHPVQSAATPFSVDSDTLPARVVREARAVDVNRLPDFSPTDRPIMTELGLQSSLGLPIVIGGRCLGAVTLSHRRPRTFDEGYIDRGMGVTQGLAVSIEKANLYQEATQRISELSLLHEVGRRSIMRESLDLSQIPGHLRRGVASPPCSMPAPCWVLLKEGDGLRGATANGEFKAQASTIRVGSGLALVDPRRPGGPSARSWPLRCGAQGSPGQPEVRCHVQREVGAGGADDPPRSGNRCAPLRRSPDPAPLHPRRDRARHAGGGATSPRPSITRTSMRI